jgi:hypothetical protein
LIFAIKTVPRTGPSGIWSATASVKKSQAFFDSLCFSIETVVNTMMLGTVHRPNQWRLTLKKEKDKTIAVSLSNKKTRPIIQNICVLIDFIFQNVNEKDRNAWHTNLMI